MLSPFCHLGSEGKLFLLSLVPRTGGKESLWMVSITGCGRCQSLDATLESVVYDSAIPPLGILPTGVVPFGSSRCTYSDRPHRSNGSTITNHTCYNIRPDRTGSQRLKGPEKRTIQTLMSSIESFKMSRRRYVSEKPSPSVLKLEAAIR